VECGVERRGNGEVAGHNLGAGGEYRSLRPAGERAYAHAGTEKFIDDEAPHTPRGTCYEDDARARACHEPHGLKRRSYDSTDARSELWRSDIVDRSRANAFSQAASA
jgi:hypothetical protein